MKQVQALMDIGSEVEVDLSLVRDRIPENLLKLLSDNPVGIVIDYKMTDGSGTGVVLRLGDGSFNWFFYEELKVSFGVKSPGVLKETNLQENNIYADQIELIKINNKKIKKFDSTKLKGKNIFNPILFIRWLLYSLKDVY